MSFINPLSTNSNPLQSALLPANVATAPSTPTGGISTGAAIRATGGFAGLFDVSRAIRSNVNDELGAAVTSVSSAHPNVGQPGSANNAGRIAGAAGNVGYSVETLRTFQAANPNLGLVLRIGLPVAGLFLITQGKVLAGALVAGAAVPFWMSR